MRAKRKGGHFCIVGGWANGKGRRVCVRVNMCVSVHLLHTVELRKKEDVEAEIQCH